MLEQPFIVEAIDGYSEGISASFVLISIVLRKPSHLNNNKMIDHGGYT